jgi:hypothetical protein
MAASRAAVSSVVPSPFAPKSLTLIMSVSRSGIVRRAVAPVAGKAKFKKGVSAEAGCCTSANAPAPNPADSVARFVICLLMTGYCPSLIGSQKLHPVPPNSLRRRDLLSFACAGRCQRVQRLIGHGRGSIGNNYARRRPARARHVTPFVLAVALNGPIFSLLCGTLSRSSSAARSAIIHNLIAQIARLSA